MSRARWSRGAGRYGAALVALGVLALAGCTSSSPDPGQTGSAPLTSTPTSTGSATTGTANQTTTTPTSSPTADSTIPAAARQQTSQGAIAFTKSFFDLVNRAYVTPESGLLRPHFTKDCSTCQGIEDNAAKYTSLGHHYNMNAVEIREVSPRGAASNSPRQTIDAVYHQNPAKIVDSVGSAVDTVNAMDGIFVVDLQWVDGAWKITSVRVLQ